LQRVPVMTQSAQADHCSSVEHWSTVAILTTKTGIWMRVCYVDCHESGLCCYPLIHIENVLRPLQLFYISRRRYGGKKISSPCRESNPCRAAHSPLLCGLSWLGCCFKFVCAWKEFMVSIPWHP
jgi:hypothetical protein